MSDQAEMLRAAGRIDDDEVVLVRVLNFLELRYELPQVSAAARREIVFLCTANFLEPRYELPQISAVVPHLVIRDLFRERVVIGQPQFEFVLSIPFTPIAEVPREGQLVQVEIERGDAFAGFKQRYNYVHGKRGFATAAFLVAYDNDVWRRRCAGWHDRCTHYYTRPFTAQKQHLPRKAEWRQAPLYGQPRNLTSSYKIQSLVPYADILLAACRKICPT